METETTVRLDPNETVYPFANKQFKDVDLVEYYKRFNSLTPNFSEPVIETNINFQGIEGRISVHAIAQVHNWDRVITPMGPVEINAKNNNGELEVTSLPLMLSLSWNGISTVEKFREIHSFEPRFVFIRDVLLLDYHQDRLDDLDQLVENWFKDGSREIPLFSATDLKTASGYKAILLPYNEFLVTSIGFGLTEKI